jgi:4-nitrophenyl phosphatase
VSATAAPEPELRSIQALIIDMDGVLWREQQALPGVAELFDLLTSRGLPFLIATNNSTSTRDMIGERLREMGAPIDPSRILTSAQAAAAFLLRQVPPGSRVYVVGETGLDRNLTWEGLSEATYAIRAGALFVGTNADVTFPTPRGLAPGAGAVLAALQAASGVAPVVVGKPEPHLFLTAVERLGTSPERTLVVGDRLETDILGAQRAGLTSALVLTGVTRPEHLEASSIAPTFVFNSLIELCQALRG